MQDVHSKGRRENKRQKVTRAVFSTELIVLRVRTFPNVHHQYELVWVSLSPLGLLQVIHSPARSLKSPQSTFHVFLLLLYYSGKVLGKWAVNVSGGAGCRICAKNAFYCEEPEHFIRFISASNFVSPLQEQVKAATKVIITDIESIEL